jgi:hypothetical protein
MSHGKETKTEIAQKGKIPCEAPCYAKDNSGNDLCADFCYENIPDGVFRRVAHIVMSEAEPYFVGDELCLYTEWTEWTSTDVRQTYVSLDKVLNDTIKILQREDLLELACVLQSLSVKAIVAALMKKA